MLCILRMLVIFVFFFFKQKTAYEMRMSDWSSDVCSSDLAAPPPDVSPPDVSPPGASPPALPPPPVRASVLAIRACPAGRPNRSPKIGRASCRERVCQYV